MAVSVNFKNPRQKRWGVFNKSEIGWVLAIDTPDYEEAQAKAKEILDKGGLFTSKDNILMCEFVPWDYIVTPRK